MDYGSHIMRSFETLREMLRDRGLDPASLDAVAPQDVSALAGARAVFHLDLPSCDCRVVYNMNPKLRLADFKKLLEPPLGGVPGGAPPATTIVVARERPNAATLRSISEAGRDVQFFDVRELQYNVTKHSLVPRHELLSEEQVEQLLTRLQLRSRSLLPRIDSSDPVARYLGLRPGNVVRISSASPSAGTYTRLRVCVRSA